MEGELEKKWESGARVRFSGDVGRAQMENGDVLNMSPDVILSLAGAIPVINKKNMLALETQMVGPMREDDGRYSDPSFLTNIIFTRKNIWRGMDLQVGVYNLFGNFAKMPSEGPFFQAQPWLRYPGIVGMVSVTYKF